MRAASATKRKAPTNQPTNQPNYQLTHTNIANTTNTAYTNTATNTTTNTTTDTTHYHSHRDAIQRTPSTNTTHSHSPITPRCDAEDTLDSGSSFSTGDLFAIRDLFNDLLTGPIVVPTFDQYVGFSNLVSTQIDDKLYNQLLGQTSFGRTFGNIFTLGTLHFAPAGPQVDSLIR